MMVRKGVHPLLHRVTVVMRNGASFQLATTMERTTPYFLREVRTSTPVALRQLPRDRAEAEWCIAPMQDTTNHPAWTGEENTVSSEDEHMARFLKRFGEHPNSSICIAVTEGTQLTDCPQ